MNSLQYSRGQLVKVRPVSVVWITNAPPQKDPLKARIMKVHPTEENPYDIVASEFTEFPNSVETRYEGVCRDGAIIRRIVPKCKSCRTEMVWHDKRKRRVCLFCDIDG